MNTIAEIVAKLRKEISDKLDEIGRLEKLLVAYPSVQRHVGRWDKVAYFTKDVNTKVERFDLRHNCGCCNDSPLELWPYVETEYGKIYSDPSCFRIGEKHWVSGDKPRRDWKEELRKAEIPESVIGVVQVHFERCRQDRIEAASSEDEVGEENEDG